MPCAESRGDHAVLNGGDGGQHSELAQGHGELVDRVGQAIHQALFWGGSRSFPFPFLLEASVASYLIGYVFFVNLTIRVVNDAIHYLWRTS